MLYVKLNVISLGADVASRFKINQPKMEIGKVLHFNGVFWNIIIIITIMWCDILTLLSYNLMSKIHLNVYNMNTFFIIKKAMTTDESTLIYL